MTGLPGVNVTNDRCQDKDRVKQRDYATKKPFGETKNYVTLQNVYEQTWKYKKNS